MSLATQARLPFRSWRHRLPALAATAALALGGLVMLATPATAAPAGVTTAYVSNVNDNTVSVVTGGTVTATIPVGSHPIDVAVTPDGTQVYVTNLSGSTVSVIDTATNTVTATIPVGAVPIRVIVNQAGTQAYVTSLGGGTVSVIDTATNAVTSTIALANPDGEAINPAGTTLYVTGAPSNVFVVDLATATVTATIAGLGGALNLAVSPDGSAVYLTQGSLGKVSVISTATNTVTGTIPVPTDADNVIFNPAGTVAYVSNQTGGDVAVINTATSTVTTTVATGPFATGLAITSDGSTLYVTNENSNNVSIVDTATNTVTSTVGVGTFPSSVALVTVPAPVVTSVSPSSGPLAAGTTVTITGTNLARASAVTFGTGHSATGVSCTATSCTAVAPAGTAGTVDVQVTTPGGTSATSGADQYTYVAAPTVTAVSPATGTTAGGTTVTITGTGLSGTTGITFGTGHPATGVSCTATSCTAIAPAEAAGTVNVQVTTAGGTSATSSADQYTYVTPFVFSGFLFPVFNPPVLNVRIAGQEILMRFGLGGNKGLGVISAGFPTTQPISCHTGAPTGPAIPTVSDGFTYDPIFGHYIYQWQTSRGFFGTCQQFTLKLIDGSTHTANFSFLF